jgi:hypothetical protein
VQPDGNKKGDGGENNRVDAGGAANLSDGNAKNVADMF